MEHIGERIRHARVAASLTQEGLAEKLNTTKATISRWENGSVGNIPMNKIDQIAEICKVNPGWIMAWTENRHRIKKNSTPFNSIWGTMDPGQLTSINDDILVYTGNSDNSTIDACYRVKDDSMVGARIFEGDIVFIKNERDIKNGDIIILSLDNADPILRRVYLLDDTILLHGENPKISNVMIEKKERDRIEVIGKVIYVQFTV